MAFVLSYFHHRLLRYVLVNFFTDVVHRWINPRMRG